MRIEMYVDNDKAIKEFEDLAVNVGAKTKIACDKMADVIRPKLISAAPYDSKSTKKHLKEVIKKTKPRKSKDGSQVVIWLVPRGLPSAKKGPNAKKNWDKDKHIYKLVVAEYGRSNLPAKPFWGVTVAKNATQALQGGIDTLKEEL